jgi:hypothetical protein
MAKKWLGAVPKTCDICQAPIVDVFVDGATKYGPWANMCTTCHSEVGHGLGTGRGQKYVLTNGDWVKEEKGAK